MAITSSSTYRHPRVAPARRPRRRRAPPAAAPVGLAAGREGTRCRPPPPRACAASGRRRSACARAARAGPAAPGGARRARPRPWPRAPAQARAARPRRLSARARRRRRRCRRTRAQSRPRPARRAGGSPARRRLERRREQRPEARGGHDAGREPSIVVSIARWRRRPCAAQPTRRRRGDAPREQRHSAHGRPRSRVDRRSWARARSPTSFPDEGSSTATHHDGTSMRIQTTWRPYPTCRRIRGKYLVAKQRRGSSCSPPRMLAAGDGSVLSWAKLFACVHNLDGQDGAPTPFATHADAPPPREPAESGAWGFVRRKSARSRAGATARPSLACAVSRSTTAALVIRASAAEWQLGSRATTRRRLARARLKRAARRAGGRALRRPLPRRRARAGRPRAAASQRQRRACRRRARELAATAARRRRARAAAARRRARRRRRRRRPTTTRRPRARRPRRRRGGRGVAALHRRVRWPAASCSSTRSTRWRTAAAAPGVMVDVHARRVHRALRRLLVQPAARAAAWPRGAACGGGGGGDGGGARAFAERAAALRDGRPPCRAGARRVPVDARRAVRENVRIAETSCALSAGRPAPRRVAASAGSSSFKRPPGGRGRWRARPRRPPQPWPPPRGRARATATAWAMRSARRRRRSRPAAAASREEPPASRCRVPPTRAGVDWRQPARGPARGVGVARPPRRRRGRRGGSRAQAGASLLAFQMRPLMGLIWMPLDSADRSIIYTPTNTGRNPRARAP